MSDEEYQIVAALNVLPTMIHLADRANDEEAVAIIGREKSLIKMAVKCLGRSVTGIFFKAELGDDGEVSIVAIKQV